MKIKLFLPGITLLSVLLVTPGRAGAADHIVMQAGDSGGNSLRESIGFANLTPGSDTIVFALIPGVTPGCDPVTLVCTLCSSLLCRPLQTP